MLRIKKHGLVSLILLGTILALLASMGNVHATTVTLIKEHHPPSTFKDPSGTYDGYLVGQTITWHLHLNVTTSTAPFPWLSISSLTITDTLPNLLVGGPLYMTYVPGSQNSSSAAGPAAFTDFGNGTLLWDFGMGPFTTGVLAPPPFSNTNDFYTASVMFNATILGTVPDNTYLTDTGVAAYTETASQVHSAPSISDNIWVQGVPRPVLNIVKINPAKVENGSSFTYVLQLSNTGHEDATGVVVQDIMPTGITHNPPATATSGSFLTDTSTNVTWTGTLFNVTNPGNTVNITIPVTANTALTSVFNNASFTVYPSDTAFINPSANCTTGIIHPAISLTKTPSASKVENGSSVTYTYTVTNMGDTPLTVGLFDNVFGAIFGGKVLAAGASNVTTICHVLTADTTNVATATGVDQTGTSVSATATATVRVIHPAISLTVLPSALKVENGSSVTYTYTVTNTGDTLFVFSLTDDVFGTIVSPWKVLGVGASNVTTISRTLTADTANTAMATGVDQTGTPVSATATATVQVYNPVNVSLLYVNPPTTVVGLNMPFTVDIDASNVSDLYSWEFKIYYTKSLLNFTGASEGSFLMVGGSTVWLDSSDPDFNETHGMVYVGASLLGRVSGVDGNGTLASISFQAHGNTTLVISEVLMLDSQLSDISFETQDGFVFIANENLVISQVNPDKRIVGQNMPINFTVTVQNLGANTQTFNVSLCLNSTAIAAIPVTDLASNGSYTFTYTWNASSFHLGNYCLNATADYVPGETNYADNTLINGTLYVGITGDISGKAGVPDGKVDMRDIGLVARAFNTRMGGQYYVPECDLNDDGKIDMRDIGIAARNFGQHYP